MKCIRSTSTIYTIIFIFELVHRSSVNWLRVNWFYSTNFWLFSWWLLDNERAYSIKLYIFVTYESIRTWSNQLEENVINLQDQLIKNFAWVILGTLTRVGNFSITNMYFEAQKHKRSQLFVPSCDYQMCSCTYRFWPNKKWHILSVALLHI